MILRYEGAFSYSRANWKSVYLLTYSEVSITNGVPWSLYEGYYPTEKIEDGKSGDFGLKVKVFFNATTNV